MQPSPSSARSRDRAHRAFEQRVVQCRMRRRPSWTSPASARSLTFRDDVSPHEAVRELDPGGRRPHVLPRERPCSPALLALHSLATAAAVLQRSHGPHASGLQHALGQKCRVSERGGANVVFMCLLAPCVEHEGGGGLIKPPPIHGVERASTTFVRSSPRKITRLHSCDELRKKLVRPAGQSTTRSRSYLVRCSLLPITPWYM